MKEHWVDLIVMFTMVVSSVYFGYFYALTVHNTQCFNGWLKEMGVRDSYLYDRIPESQILVTDKSIQLLGQYYYAQYKNTSSMLPIIDKGTNGIYLKYNDTMVLHPGEIISYMYENSSISHRIIRISEDDFGRYYVVKGDNNVLDDPVKVRDRDISGVLVAVIY